jgi:hypothetical protein
LKRFFIENVVEQFDLISSHARLPFLLLPLHTTREFDRAEIRFACSDPKRNSPTRFFIFCGRAAIGRAWRQGRCRGRVPARKERIITITDFLDHLTNDVIPELINRRLGR